MLPDQARSRQCKADGCGKRPVFNFPGERLPVYCQNHKEPNMVDVLNRLCTFPGALSCLHPACTKKFIAYTTRTSLSPALLHTPQFRFITVRGCASPGFTGLYKRSSAPCHHLGEWCICLRSKANLDNILVLCPQHTFQALWC
jgi:hypothetical protein